MPCSEGGFTDSQLKEKELDKMKTMLCSACASLEARGFDFRENPALDEWWDKHKKQDEEKFLKERQLQAKTKEFISVFATIRANMANKLGVDYDELTPIEQAAAREIALDVSRRKNGV